MMDEILGSALANVLDGWLRMGRVAHPRGKHCLHSACRALHQVAELLRIQASAVAITHFGCAILPSDTRTKNSVSACSHNRTIDRGRHLAEFLWT